MNKRGIALIVAFMVIVVLTTFSLVIFVRSMSERSIAQRYVESTQAFWLAEAGVNRALKELKADYSVSSGNCKWETNLGAGRYCVDLGDKDINGRRTLTAYGYVPFTTPARAERKISVLVESSGSNPSNPELITYAIETTGTLRITGSVDIHPSGSSHQNSNLTFEEVFGMTEDQVKAIAISAQDQGAGHVYTNPPANQQPVNGITWVDLTGSNKYSISSNWSGSGLLIVNSNGNDVALDISGAWTFTGMIWVTGRVKISGTPVINGAIFAKSSIDAQSDFSGNATINFNSTDVSSAFSSLGGGGSGELTVLSWREI